MGLRRQHIHGVARAIAKALQAEAGLRCTGGLGEIETCIAATIHADLAAERTLNDEADKLLDKQLRLLGAAGRDLDLEKARQLIKKELAKQRGFVL
ncbi:MAG: DUF507 family protein [Deltaproteobacteria bacterium]|nr:DUF507 family protein [Deltaproteobacteria bacterium]